MPKINSVARVLVDKLAKRTEGGKSKCKPIHIPYVAAQHM
jgi:hypothetical protein